MFKNKWNLIMQFDSTHNATCLIHNTDKDKTVEAEVLDFKPQKRLVVSLERAIKLTLSYDPRHAIYVGSMSGLEFTTDGPTQY